MFFYIISTQKYANNFIITNLFINIYKKYSLFFRGRKKHRKNVKSRKFYKQQKAAKQNLAKRNICHEFAYELTKIISHHFPNLHEQLKTIVDVRKINHYGINEIIFGGIGMFVFKSGSRNNMDNVAGEHKFKKNFRKAFGCRLPKMDTIAVVFKKMPPEELENLKVTLVKQLLENKMFDKWRQNGKVVIAIDATGLVTFNERHCDKCLVRHYKINEKRKVEKTVYFHNVLEAKLVTSNGFSISLCTEWIENNGEEYDKQDCERKAFERMAEKLKLNFPRLAICLCADGLYPNNTFFEICKKNCRDYIVTLTDKSLKGLWEKIRPANRDYKKNEFDDGPIQYNQAYQYINNIEHNGYIHNWIQMDEIQTQQNGKIQKFKFVHLTNIPLSHENALLVSNTGRLRWKIEKQGFDRQKNHGYNIGHKYCRKSYIGLKNFYQCCQIAHLFNQLVELSKNFEKYVPAKKTVKHVWTCLWAFMLYGDISEPQIIENRNHKTQIQYIS
jgi:hypothetical protein